MQPGPVPRGRSLTAHRGEVAGSHRLLGRRDAPVCAAEASGPGDGARGAVLAGRFRLADQVGRPEWGWVFRAVDVRRVRALRLRLLSPEVTVGVPMARILKDVLAASSRVDHAGIVKVRSAGRVDRGHLVAEDWDDGPSLADVLVDGPLRATQVADLAADLVDALDAAHRGGLVHGGITVEDVRFVDGPDGPTRLGGFGIAGVVQRSRAGRAGTLVDHRYLAPEQLGGAPPTEAADRWAIGGVLFHALTGQPPFGPTGWSEGSMLDWTLPTPAPLRSMIGGLLDPEPGERADWSVVRAVPASAPPDVPPPRIPRWAAVALAVCLALVGSGALMVGRQPPEVSVTASVPDLRGAPLETATGLLEEAGLAANVQTQRSTDTDVGTVLSQRPGSGGRLTIGEQVTLVVSVGRDRVEVPDLIGLPEVGARVRSQSADLLISVIERHSEQAEPGEVIGQRPQPGETVQRLSEVEVVVAAGRNRS